ncbi:MAG: hypothetical protein AAGI52_06515 [Bacteroidota bacterium]
MATQRSRELAAIHAIKSKLGMSDDDCRAALVHVVSVDSARKIQTSVRRVTARAAERIEAPNGRETRGLDPMQVAALIRRGDIVLAGPPNGQAVYVIDLLGGNDTHARRHPHISSGDSSCAEDTPPTSS